MKTKGAAGQTKAVLFYSLHAYQGNAGTKIGNGILKCVLGRKVPGTSLLKLQATFSIINGFDYPVHTGLVDPLSRFAAKRVATAIGLYFEHSKFETRR